MSLTVLRESCRMRGSAGVYVGGFTIAPDGLLIVADNYSEAWEIMVDHYAEMGALAECEHDNIDDIDDCDACDFGSSGGPYVTADLVLRVVRHAAGE